MQLMKCLLAGRDFATCFGCEFNWNLMRVFIKERKRRILPLCMREFMSECERECVCVCVHVTVLCRNPDLNFDFGQNTSILFWGK